jgi:hypothetical protein
VRLGEAEAVHLHAVAEAAGLGVGDAVALEADAVPQLGERPQLADLLDEADARVDEERDRAEHLGELLGLDLAAVRTASSTSIAVASENAISCTGVAPASCRWYEHTFIGFHLGACCAHQATMSTISRLLARAGRCTCRATGTP